MHLILTGSRETGSHPSVSNAQVAVSIMIIIKCPGQGESRYLKRESGTDTLKTILVSSVKIKEI